MYSSSFNTTRPSRSFHQSSSRTAPPLFHQNTNQIPGPPPSEMADTSSMDWQPSTPPTNAHLNPDSEQYMPGGWPLNPSKQTYQILGRRAPTPTFLPVAKKVCRGLSLVTSSAVNCITTAITNIGRVGINVGAAGASFIVTQPTYVLVRQFQRRNPREPRRATTPPSTSPWQRAVNNNKRRREETPKNIQDAHPHQNMPMEWSISTEKVKQKQKPFENRCTAALSSIQKTSTSHVTEKPRVNLRSHKQSILPQRRRQYATITPPNDDELAVASPILRPTKSLKLNKDVTAPALSPDDKINQMDVDQHSNNNANKSSKSPANQKISNETDASTRSPPSSHPGQTSILLTQNGVIAKQEVARLKASMIMRRTPAGLDAAKAAGEGLSNDETFLTPPPIKLRRSLLTTRKSTSENATEATRDVKSVSKSPDMSEISSTYGLPPDSYSFLQVPRNSTGQMSPVPTVSDISSTYDQPSDSYSYLKGITNSPANNVAGKAVISPSKLGQSISTFGDSSSIIVSNSPPIRNCQPSHAESIIDSPQAGGGNNSSSSVIESARKSPSDLAEANTSINSSDGDSKNETSGKPQDVSGSPVQKKSSKSSPSSSRKNPDSPSKSSPDSPIKDNVKEEESRSKTPVLKFAQLTLDEYVPDQSTPKATPHSTEKSHRQTRAEKKKEEAKKELQNYEIGNLSEEWESKVQDALRAGHKKLKASDLTRVVPITAGRGTDNWLNDEVINEYLQLVVAHGKKNDRENQSPSHHAFSSFFFNTLREKGYDGVKRWATRAKIGGRNLLHTEQVFIPINSGMHWTLCVISGTKRTITYYNSMRGSGKTYVDIIMTWVQNELGRGYEESEWTVNYSGESPQQTNSDDCGVFTITSARQIMLGFAPMSYRPQQIPLQRRRIVAELINGGLIKSTNDG